MRKLFGVSGTVAVLAWAIPAFALVSDTNITSTNGQPLGGATLSLVTHHANGAHHNYSGQVAQNGHARVAINTKEDKPNTGVTVEILIVKDGVTYTADGVPAQSGSQWRPDLRSPRLELAAAETRTGPVFTALRQPADSRAASSPADMFPAAISLAT